VGNEPIHHPRDRHARDEPQHHQREARAVEAAGAVHAGERLGEQPERRRRQHQTGAEAEDAVIHASRERAHEEEREGAEPGGKPRESSGEEGVAHAGLLAA
jgi:hypothetical protein